ncbi:MAG: TlpA family protein disulfide reductase [Bernardetiaceae bacterium]
MNKKKIRRYLDWGLTGTLVILLLIPATRVEIVGGVQRILLATGIMDASTDDPPDMPPTGKLAYALPLQDLGGGDFRPLDLAGKVVFINFWATWCPPCVAEMPEIHALYEKMLPEGDVVFLMISLDQDPSKAVDFVERKGYQFPVYALRGSLPDVYAHSAIPTTFVLDPRGKVAFKREGMASYDTEEFRAFLLGLKEKS